ncbi:MAG TPA: hypothetical protein VLR89_10630 [Anaerolineaceae bacterium]|nr:hypothetical protein [Anaerolineaceae bacterium]
MFLKKILLIFIVVIFMTSPFSVEAATTQRIATDTDGPGDEPLTIQQEDYTPTATRDLALQATTVTRWFNMPGATFLPHSSSVTWGYGGAGCLDPSTTGTWRAPLLLLDDAQITFVTFGYYNSAEAVGSTARLYRYTWDGDSIQVKSLTAPSGTSRTGYYYVSAIIDPPVTVDNWNNSYALVWDGSTTQDLCYMQVGYTLPFSAIYLPTVAK